MDPVLFFSLVAIASIIGAVIRRKLNPSIKKKERLFGTIVGTFGWILFIVWVPLFLGSLVDQTDKTASRVERIVEESR